MSETAWQRMARWRWTGALMALVLAGCGGGGGGGDTPPPAPTTYRLSVTATGTGGVSSAPAGIDCGATCAADFARDTAVTLTAAPGSGFVFSGWGGACSGNTPTCSVTMSEARAVSATFTRASSNFPLTITVAGGGSVRSQPTGIDCGSICNASFAASTSVTLTATAASGQSFQGWGGACSGQAATCTVTMDAARSVSATFVPVAPVTFALDVSVTGNGTVTSQPVGISCGSACSARYTAGTSVVLTATPAQGQVLSGWGGACSGQATTCTVTMDAARAVTAAFAAAPPAPLAWSVAELLEASNDFNVAGTNLFADANILSAIDAAGNALVIWQQSDGTPDGSTQKVFSRRYVAGQGWSPAVAVPGLSTSSSAVTLVTGRLLMDAAGNAVWIRSNFETRRFTVASGWSTTAFLPANSSGGSVADVKLATDGTVHLLGIGGSVLYSRLAPGSSQWTAWADVSQSTLSARHAQLALGAQGSLIAVWSERNPGDSNYSMRAGRSVGGTWQAPVRIEELLTNVNDATPRLASDAAGNALAVWFQGSSIYLSRFDAGTSQWTTPSELDGQISTTFAPRLQLAMAADGRAVVAWNSTFALRSSSVAANGTAAAPVAINTYSAGHFLGIDDSGRAVVVYRSPNQWPNPTDGTLNLYVRELAWGGSWTNAALLESGGGEVKANTPCAMNASGQAVCVWAQDDLPNNTVRNSLWGTVRR